VAAEARAAGDLDAGALDELEATERAVREAMRLYPPAYTHFREPTEDVTIGGYRVPAGATVSLPQWQVQRDGRWWDDPDTFDPRRWRGEDERPEYAYFPFGGGPRHCIGMRFARAELKLTLAAVLREWELVPETKRDVELNPGVNLSPGEPVELRVRERP
jgi:cytochrome P450